MSKKIIVAVDGTAGSGKTVTFKQVAKQIGYEFIDTGLMYRAFTLLCIKNKVDFNNNSEIIKQIKKFNYKVMEQVPFLDDIDVEIRLQQSDIIKNINYVSSIKEIRKFMVEKQRAMVVGGGFIEIGRDITSVVLPNADLKIYLDSSAKSRAKRRHDQNLQNNIKDKSLEEIENEIIKRDINDKANVLKLVNDAWYIDNSNLSIDQVVEMVIIKIKELENK